MIRKVVTAVIDGSDHLQHSINCLIYDKVEDGEQCVNIQVILLNYNEYLVILSICYKNEKVC